MSFNKKPKTIDPDEVDPSVYYYDEVYDDMKDEEKAKREDADRPRGAEKQKSKYIQGLLETAELRKTEKEIRQFKRYAKDREEAEASGTLDGSDVYTTSAYRKKLDEVKRLDQEKRRRIEHEEDRMLNTLKKQSSNREGRSSKISTIVTEDDRDIATTFDHVPQVASEPRETSDSKSAPKKQLKTSRDRKYYLREVLAKRTIGQAFEAARERYKQRSATSKI